MMNNDFDYAPDEIADWKAAEQGGTNMVEGLQKRISELEQSIGRRDRINGELIDDIQCQKGIIEEQEKVIADYRDQVGRLRQARLDETKCQRATENDLRAAREEIGRLQTLNEVPSAHAQLVSGIVQYVQEQVDEAIEARFYDQ